MRTLIDFQDAPLYAIPMIDGGVREGMLIEGPQGWGEFSPDPAGSATHAARWLTAAIEPGTVGWPDPVRGRIPIAVVVPALDPSRIHDVIRASGCAAADLTVTAHPDSLAEDIARVRAAREALGAGGALRCDAGGRWDAATAVAAISALDRAAGGLDYVVQPCRTLDDNAAVRGKVEVPVALRANPEVIATSPRTLAEAADLLVLGCGALGGARRALRIAEQCGLVCTVASTGETSIGLSAALALAGALPELPHACGVGTLWQLTGDLVAPARSMSPVDGYLPVAPMPPGPDPDRLRQFTMTDPRRITVWQNLIHQATAVAP